MPKMFKYRIFLFIFLLPLFVFAQTIPLKSNILPEKNTTLSFRLTLQFQATSQITQGMILHFSPRERVFPEKILVDGKSLWLQQSRRIPQVDNAVHWFYADSVLELRFNLKTLKPGAGLDLNLHVSELQPDKGNISVGLLPLDASARNVNILGQTTIPLPQNPQK